MKNRVIYVDLLRITAAFSVVLLHVAAGNWGNAALGAYEWKVFNFYDSLVRFGVPIFVMVSGMFLLNPDKHVSCKDIYSKYIMRIITVFISWSFLYALYENMSGYNVFDIQLFIKSFVFGHYHLWYLYMLVGLYIITPFLKKIAEDKKATEYFLLLSLIFTFILPITIKLFNLKDLDLFIKKFDLNFIVGYVGYYIGGYYISNHEFNKNKRNIIYIAGVSGLVCTYIFTDILSMHTGKADSTFYSYFAPNVMIVSVALFIFFKYEISRIKFSPTAVKIINILSGCSFRIYLIHDFFIMFITKSGFSTLKSNPAWSVPAMAVLVFILSLTASFIIGKTPLLKRIL